MNYQKHFSLSLLLALVVGLIGYFLFGYLPFDCADYANLPAQAQLQCNSQAVLGVGFWLPYVAFFCFVSIVLYWLVYLTSGWIWGKICKNKD
ncbi:hypothetical protein A4G20_00605 [Pasteurellaceae bacterium RH1A]|nr:hypothetical protein A4G20_00605 [Pasteurellaceae bacterium RH1A]